jgi:murein DD-endopeptidase MepM/ murein hydrolase activator NlpD
MKKYLVYPVLIAFIFGFSVPSVSARHRSQDSDDVQEKINELSDTAEYPMVIPVLFGVAVRNLSQNFGDPRSGGRLHEGQDIMAVKGTPIISPTSAVVIRVGVGSGEGNYVYTANPGGETFVYMHLDRIGEGVVRGAVLEKGSLIGYVGNTGNASGGAAHLHMEIHNSDGVPMSAYPRLTIEATLADKMEYLSDIFTQTTDSAALAQFLISHFRSNFTEAQAAGIPLPKPITDILAPVSTGSTLLDGDLVRAQGEVDVYIVKFVGTKKFKRLILSPSVFRSYGHLRWENVKNVGPTVLATLVTSDLVRALEDGQVFRLYPNGDTGQKRWIRDEETFNRLGLDWDSIYEINNTDRDSYVTGAPLQ